MNVILLFGLPCSGKSSVIKALSSCNRLAVDDVIKNHSTDPSIEDFRRLSKTLMTEIIRKITASTSNCHVIEMGCLIHNEAINYLQESLIRMGAEVINITLHAHDNVLINRITERNKLFEQGLSNSFPIEGPDYLTRFKQIFEKNKPDDSIELDTSEIDLTKVLLEVQQIIYRRN